MQNKIHIWQASTEEAKKNADALIATLSSEELSRGHRLIDPERSQRFLLAQAILRNVLSRYVNQSASVIEFQRGDHGKPYLLNTDVQFNLTHSHQCVLVAVTTQQEIGIDVEYLKREHRFDDLIQRFFSPEEQQEYLQYSSETERRLAFYRGWTRKEAYLKATGLGLSYPLQKFSVSLAPDEEHALLQVERNTDVRSKWTLLSFNIDKNYLASLAVESDVDSLETYHWSFSFTS